MNSVVTKRRKCQTKSNTLISTNFESNINQKNDLCTETGNSVTSQNNQSKAHLEDTTNPIKSEIIDTNIKQKKRRGRPRKLKIIELSTCENTKKIDNVNKKEHHVNTNTNDGIDKVANVVEDNLEKKQRVNYSNSEVSKISSNKIIDENIQKISHAYSLRTNINYSDKTEDHYLVKKENQEVKDLDSEILQTNVSISTNTRKRKGSSELITATCKVTTTSNLNSAGNRDIINEKELISENEDKSDCDEFEKYTGKKRKYLYKTHRKRKKGRPKGTIKTINNDNDYLPHHSQINQPPKSETIKQNSSSKQAVIKMVECGKCNMKILKNQWSHHNLSRHNDLGWLEGTIKPDFENDEKLVKRVLFNAIKKRKGSLICEICNTVKRSVLGFLSHVTFCGKDEEETQALMVTCPVCKAVTKPSSIEYHERIHKIQVENKEKSISLNVENLDSGQKLKRKAAERAVSKISEFTALVKDDNNDRDNNPVLDKKLQIISNSVKKLILKPQFSKRISNSILGKWKKNLSLGQNASCSQLGCNFLSTSLDEMKQHYSNCNFTPQENFVCKICRFESSSECEIVRHAFEKHSAEDKDDANLSISDMESSASENDYEIDNDSEKCQGLLKKFFFKESTEFSNKMFKFLFSDGNCHTKNNKPFFPAFQWTLQFEKKNYKFHLFNECLPNMFNSLNKEQIKNYLPELKESMLMKNVKFNCKSSKESEWKKWKIFEGQCIQDNPTFFTGGPIWALAWLPIPSSLAFSENISQFIAISTHSSMDIQYSVGKVYSGKNIIQIWNVGDLNNRLSKNSNPQLAYAIVHDGGTVWCLDWCPSGCYQYENLSKKNIHFKRMGLLAAACSDGCVRIYSLIFPEDLKTDEKLFHTSENCKNDTNVKYKYPIYNTEPVLVLIVNIKIYDNKQHSWQVTKLSWTKEKDHNILVAGFSNGYIALWDLTTNSPMLKFKRGNTVFLNPYRHFLAHHHAITMVYLIPQDNKRFLATASLDRYYKFWDLEDITNPRNSLKKSFVTDGSWLNNWSCALITYDDALSMNHTYSYCLPLREYTYKYYNIFPTNSTSYTISTSDFGNSVANGTLAGEVLAMFPQQLLYIRDMDKTLPRKRYISMVSSLEVIDFEAESQNKESLNNKNQETKNDKIQYSPKPSTYNDSKNRFGLKFCDKMSNFHDEGLLKQSRNHKKTLTCEMMQNVPIEQYPFMSANRVSWNPNAWSFLWLAVGYENGFLRLIQFKSLTSTTEWNKQLNSFIDLLKQESTTKSAIAKNN